MIGHFLARSNAHAFTQLVHDRYDNPGSRRTRLAPFLAACKKLGYSEAYQIYFRPFQKDNNPLKELREKQAAESGHDSTKYTRCQEKRLITW
jgi:hypothetical protein